MTININYENTRPKVCAFFAGRVWYAGIESSQKNGWVMFSQVATDLDKFAKCYQDGDPTSEVFSDIADNDGGVIPIPDAGEIVELKALGSSMVVFATNGIWQILGGDNGFTATSYSVQKITNAGCANPKTVVEVEDFIIYWSSSGIMSLQVDQVGASKADNITELTIKSFYLDIPVANRMYAQGVYNRTQKIVWWVYNKDAVLSQEDRYVKNRVLCFDTRIGAWYAYDLAETSATPVALAVTSESSRTSESFSVYVGASSVVVGADEVVSNVSIDNPSSQTFKFMTLATSPGGFGVTWSEMYKDDYKDWGVDAPAYMITGYNMGSTGPGKAKTLSYIQAFLKRCPIELDGDAQPLRNASVKLQTRWDFTDSQTPNKWGTEYETYRLLRPYFAEPSTTVDDGYPLVITKNKIRGRGKAVQLKWSSSPLKEMKIVGWSAGFVENTNV